jgi:hypothetical protein
MGAIERKQGEEGTSPNSLLYYSCYKIHLDILVGCTNTSDIQRVSVVIIIYNNLPAVKEALMIIPGGQFAKLRPPRGTLCLLQRQGTERGFEAKIPPQIRLS